MGRVKTRLGREIGPVAATWFFRHAVRTTLVRLARAPWWETILSTSPDTALLSRAWPAGMARVRQGGGDIGQRMQRAIDALPPGPVIVVGSDIPAMEPRHVRAAFRALAGADVVLAPADDGGFWLVGARRRPATPRLFRAVRWSSEHTLADTRAGLAGSRVAIGPTLSDVDTAADLACERGRSGRIVRGPDPH